MGPGDGVGDQYAQAEERAADESAIRTAPPVPMFEAGEDAANTGEQRQRPVAPRRDPQHNSNHRAKQQRHHPAEQDLNVFGPISK